MASLFLLSWLAGSSDAAQAKTQMSHTTEKHRAQRAGQLVKVVLDGA